MFNITQCHEAALAMHNKGQEEFNKSQQYRMRSLSYYKESGERLIEIKEYLKEKNAHKTNPVETPLGTFTSFNDYLNQKGWDDNRAYAYIKLAQHWDIVTKLGMQDESNETALGKSMRLCRTLKIINWYLKNVNLGRPESELTLEQYWMETEDSSGATTSGPTKRQLQEQLESANFEISQLKDRIASLERQLAERPGASIANSPAELRSVFNKLRAKPVEVSVS